MSDTLPTVWSAEQHTVAKHRILQAYLAAWMPILSSQSRNVGAGQQGIKYIDGYAGPGIYEKGEKGSPVLALEAALNHSRDFPVPVHLIFIESDKDRFRVLEGELAKYADEVARSQKVTLPKPLCEDCRIVIDKMLADCRAQRQKFGPALVFLDQFGYSSVPMDLIGRILAEPQCEVLTYFFWRDLDRFITDPNKHQGITAAFGGEEWRPAIQLSAGERERFMLRTYTSSLKDRAGAKYVWPFAMLDENERLLYWLFFCTNNIRGLEEMKRAMWKVDQTGAFAFSDKDGFAQLKFLTHYTDDRLAADIERGLAGQTLKVKQLFEWVLTDTPAYKFKGALASLERRKVVKPINPPKSRRPGTYADGEMLVRIEASMFQSR